jgi:hypothetical protein
MLLEEWFRAFVLTAIIEIPIVVALTRKSPFATWRRAGIALFAQLATHPAVWFVFPQIVGLTGRESLGLSELWAWLAEGSLYALAIPGVRPVRAFGASALANGASFGLGLALHAWGAM